MSSGKTTEELASGGLSYQVVVEATVVVEVTSATATVRVDAETVMHAQAWLYCSASEHWSLRYAGTVLSGAEAVTVSPLFFNTVWDVGNTASAVTVTVTTSLYSVTHDVLNATKFSG